MSDNVIEIRNIVRDFKLGQETVHVLKGIDLDIKKGEYVAIMGPQDRESLP
jgi:putative ABC transport system ATP-binding protein